MKKIIKFFVLIFIMMQLVTVNAAEVTIDTVINSFQNGTLAKQYKGANAVFEVTHDSDSIDIKIVVNEETTNVSLDLNGNIVSAKITNDDNSNEDFITMYMFLSLMDEVGVLHGYEAGEISKALNSGLMNDYKLVTDGFEIEKVSESTNIYKFDFTKKIVLPSYDNVYITPSDIETYKEYLVDTGAMFSVSRGNVIIYKSSGDLINFSICEKGELTSNTYNTSVSAVEVLFDDDKVVNYYKNNYPSLLGDKSFDGFVIKTDSTKFTEEDLDVLPFDPNNTLDGYVCSVIYVDTELAKEAATVETKPEEEPEIENPKEDKDEEKNNNLVLYIAIAAGAVVVIGIVVFIVVKRKKNKNNNNNNTPQAPTIPQASVMPQASVNNTEVNQNNVQPVVSMEPQVPPTVEVKTPVEVTAPASTVVTSSVVQEVQTTSEPEMNTNVAENKVEETSSVVEEVCPNCGEKKSGKFCMKCGYKFQ